ncbi:DUF2264 domain-containing protein [Micromonospora sp. M12]
MALADRMLAAARPYASPGHALVTFPGRRAVTGRPSTAWRVRSHLPAGRLPHRGCPGVGVDELVDRYATGIAAGTDPSSPDRWVRLDEHPRQRWRPPPSRWSWT